ncbi:MarR family transcriptional regulator [Allokutzneria sp. A3M-2-11 16]|uniref:MarR family winged helix-turn-helix transcriptional regulator n=1 Tax=Allokutzneria sp. A3M-2-11 16 TaxID=2962043 RepID=UPI0020B7CCF7|nr:MarR family transcriptional regulator [Allokutzneria sp. A3M-2-11 16]MCP3802836.1 MarR family transcriptional regulator [Allokutzneria sp. A3M-2-11 16]
MTNKDELITEVIDAMPDWAVALVQLNALIADRMGVVTSDLHCLHALNHHGPATPGVLAERVGLSPGAASRMVDRLDAAGCVRRVPDPKDRRRVLIEPTEEGLRRADAYYAGLAARTREDLADVPVEHIRALREFIAATRESTLAELQRLRAR